MKITIRYVNQYCGQTLCELGIYSIVAPKHRSGQTIHVRSKFCHTD